MNITTIGRGNLSGGRARCRERAGHTVTRLGREGGDAADALRPPRVLLPVRQTGPAVATSAGRRTETR
jgi:hypothetical protein